MKSCESDSRRNDSLLAGAQISADRRLLCKRCIFSGSPSCTVYGCFQEVLPTAAGDLLFTEYKTLSQVQENPAHPSVFVLGGAKISDAFGMMEQVLAKGTADRILTTGVTGAIFLLASGVKVGKQYEDWLNSKQFLVFVDDAKRYLEEYGDRIEMPRDLAYAADGVRYEIPVSELPKDDASFLDIGEQTQKDYREIILGAKTLFANGPAGVYEETLFENGTRVLAGHR